MEKIYLGKNSIKELKCVSKFCSKDKSRYYLTNVVYDNKLKNIVALDGKSMIVINTDLSRNTEELLEEKNYKISIIDDENILISEETYIEKSFPEYLRIIPKEDNLIFRDVLHTNKKRDENLKGIGLFLSSQNVYLDINYLLQLPNLNSNIYNFFTVAKEDYRTLPCVFKGELLLGSATVITMPIKNNLTLTTNTLNYKQILCNLYPLSNNKACFYDNKVVINKKVRLRKEYIEIVNKEGKVELFWIGNITELTFDYQYDILKISTLSGEQFSFVGLLEKEGDE